MKGHNKQPVKCDHCEREFASGAGLALHMRWVNGMTHPMKGQKFSEEKRAQYREYIEKAKAASPSHNTTYVEKVCEREGCEKVFSLPPGKAKRQRFCSQSCAHRGKVISLEHREAVGKSTAERYKSNPRSNPFFGRTPTNYQGWGYGSFVEELGHWVRSTWERDYLLALSEAGISYEYEPERFDLGDSTYLPDARIIGSDLYLEITGWDKPGKEAKRDKFVQVYGYDLIVVKDRPTERTKRELVERIQAMSAA